MRIALFGGSFDPPHLGHLRIALTAAERLRLDLVLLAPVGRQPLKRYDLAPFADRMQMLSLLTSGHPQLAPSAIDAPLHTPSGESPNYTVDTLARLRPTLPNHAELFFLAGADSFLTLHHWYRAELLLQPAREGGLLDGWILAGRPGFSLDALRLPPGYTLGPRRELPGPEIPSPDAFGPDAANPAAASPLLLQEVRDFSGAPATPLFLLPDLDDPSTATCIREAFAAGAEPPHLGPPVARYIRERGLYTVLR